MTDIKEFRFSWKSGLGLVFCLIPLFLLFYYFGESALAMPTICSAGMIVFAIAMRWSFRRHTWFWITIAVLVVLHIGLIKVVPWTSKWVPAIVITPFAVADLWAMLGVIKLMEKLFGSEPPAQPVD
jgi:hypothetical protein